MKKLIIMRGVPGSGKSTYVERNFPDAWVCSADFYRYEASPTTLIPKYVYKPEDNAKNHFLCLRDVINHFCNEETEIVVDNIHAKLVHMKPYLDAAKAFGYEVEVIRMIRPARDCAAFNVHNVPYESIERAMITFQPYSGEKIVNFKDVEVKSE